jgi:orotidine-5'-phosphate decarboxylase
MSRIILPLDGMSTASALDLVKSIPVGLVSAFKVNSLLLREGIGVVTKIVKMGHSVMADPKLYDIPNTMRNSVGALVNEGADIVTVHCSAGWNPESFSPFVAGVTVLTSMSDQDAASIYGVGVEVAVLRMAKRIKDFHYGFMVCSVHEIRTVKASGFTGSIICPGIRPNWYPGDDQTRTATVQDAVKAGADFVVIGRPILRADDIMEAVIKTNNEIEEASS